MAIVIKDLTDKLNKFSFEKMSKNNNQSSTQADHS